MLYNDLTGREDARHGPERQVNILSRFRSRSQAMEIGSRRSNGQSAGLIHLTG
jgi:hypothetical protein